MAIYSVFLAKNKKDKFLVYADKFYSSYRSELVEFEQNLHQNILSMLQMLKELAKANKKNVLLVSHGWTDGLWLPLFDKSADTSTTDRLATILIMSKADATAKKLISDKEPEKWFPDSARRSLTLRELAEVFPAHDFNFKDEKAAHKALTAGKTGAQGKVMADIQSKVNTASRNQSALASLGPVIQKAVRDWWPQVLTKSGLGDDRMAAAYFDAIGKVQAVGISSVEIRGCKIGASSASSQVLRLFLGAKKLRAPTEVLVTQNPTAGVEVKPGNDPLGIRWDNGSGYVRWSPGGVYRTNSKAAWEIWINDKIGKPRGKAGLNMPLMLLEGSVNSAPQYPKDPGFAKLLASFS